MESRARRAGRPTERVLDRGRIFRGALEVIDRDGPAAFTMAGLARLLGVEPASLYNHVSGRAEIVEGVRGVIVTEIAMPDFGSGTWVEALRGWAHSYRDSLAGHPNTIQLLATTPIRSDRYLEMYEAVVDGLRAAGWPMGQIADVLTTLESFLIGSALDLAAPPLMYDARGRDEDYPLLVEALGGPAEQRGRADHAFEFGLDLLLSSLRTLRGA
ncbi:MAG: TetR/AcrR family transcriptional regulator [Nocardioidaceae bacterium]